SDILLGKPGGLTSSEALARGLAFVIVNPIPGQEERNSDHLLEQGVAIRCNNLPVLAYKIDCLLDDPSTLERMPVAARCMSSAWAACDSVNLLRLQPAPEERKTRPAVAARPSRLTEQFSSKELNASPRESPPSAVVSVRS